MLLKWIVCRVPDHLKGEFSIAQAAWRQLASIPGFIAQVGGWNLKSSNEACIASVWQDRSSYEQFMQETHDAVVAESKQSSTYDEIKVSEFARLLAISGTEIDFYDAMRNSVILRVVDCLVDPDRDEHFIDAEREIWIPGMQTCDGMLGGVFAKAVADDSHFLVTSCWRSIEAHETYVQQVFQNLADEAGTEEDINQITSYLVRLDKTWEVISSQPLV